MFESTFDNCEVFLAILDPHVKQKLQNATQRGAKKLKKNKLALEFNFTSKYKGQDIKSKLHFSTRPSVHFLQEFCPLWLEDKVVTCATKLAAAD